MSTALFIIPGLTFGGIETQALYLAKHLIKTHKMSVVFWGVIGEQETYKNILEKEGISYEMHPELLNFFSSIYANSNLFEKINMWFKLWLQLAKKNFSVIFPYTSRIDLIFNVISIFIPAKGCFSFERGGYPNKLPIKKENFYTLLSKHSSPIYISNSEHGKKALAKIKNIPEKKINVIRNAFIPKPDYPKEKWENKIFALSKKHIIITMLANFFPEKDHKTILMAMLKIKSNHPFKLIFAGRGESPDTMNRYAEIKTLARNLQIEESVYFTGSISNTRKLLEISDIGILSTKTEGCPNAILEYMGAGLPIVGTDIPGIREIIPESNKDFLFPIGHIDQCAKKLEEMINYPHLRTHIGSLNKIHVNKYFTVNKMNSAYSTILKEKGIVP